MSTKIKRAAQTVAVLSLVSGALARFNWGKVYPTTARVRQAAVRGIRRAADALELGAYTVEQKVDYAFAYTQRSVRDLKLAGIEKHKALVIAEQRRLNEEATFISAAAVERIKKAMDEAGNEHNRALSLRNLTVEHAENHKALEAAHG